jgi:hypothetical protein
MAADVMRRDGGFVPSWVSIPLWLTGAATPAMADEATDAKRAGLDPPPAPGPGPVDVP